MSELGLPEGYVRQEPRPWDDFAADPRVVWQPLVYDVAASIARDVTTGVERVVDVGCGSALKLLARSWGGLPLVGVDTPETVAKLRERHPALERPRAQWVEADLEVGLPGMDLSGALVICADVIEHLRNPRLLLFDIAEARAAVISTPDRERARGLGDMGPPANKAHAQEWTRDELVEFLRSEIGMRVAATWTQSKSTSPAQNTILAVME